MRAPSGDVRCLQAVITTANCDLVFSSIWRGMFTPSLVGSQCNSLTPTLSFYSYSEKFYRNDVSKNFKLQLNDQTFLSNIVFEEAAKQSNVVRDSKCWMKMFDQVQTFSSIILYDEQCLIV